MTVRLAALRARDVLTNLLKSVDGEAGPRDALSLHLPEIRSAYRLLVEEVGEDLTMVVDELWHCMDCGSNGYLEIGGDFVCPNGRDVVHAPCAGDDPRSPEGKCILATEVNT